MLCLDARPGLVVFTESKQACTEWVKALKSMAPKLDVLCFTGVYLNFISRHASWIGRDVGSTTDLNMMVTYELVGLAGPSKFCKFDVLGRALLARMR